MNVIIKNTLFIITIFIQVFLQYLIVTETLYKKTISLKFILGSVISSLFIILIVHLHVFNIILILFISIANLFFVYLIILRYSKIAALIAVLLHILLITIIECFIYVIFYLITPSFGLLKDYYTLVSHIVTVRTLPIFILLAIYILIKKFNIKVHLSDEYKIMKTIFIRVVFILLFIIPNAVILEKYKLKLPLTFKLYNLFFLMCFCGYSVISIFKENEANLRKQENESQKIYINSLELSLDKLRGFKHDFSNIITTIRGYLALKRYDDLARYINELHADFTPLNSAAASAAIKETPLLYGLILSKISMAEVYNVNLNLILLTTDIKTDNIKLCDICRIIGILLDNAIESAMECRIKNVDFCIKEKDGKTIITISNTCKLDEAIDVDLICKKNYTTKSGHSGLGLYQVNSIIKKYKRFMVDIDLLTEYQNGFFTQTLTF